MKKSPRNDAMADMELDLGHCSGCQACMEMCPEVFGWDDDLDRPVLKTPCGPREQVIQVAAFCPKDCIRVADWKRDW